MSRNKYPEETIKLILDVSEKLFLEKGYDNTSIQDIINGLGGLSKGAVYHHFKSKEEIFNAVGDRFNEQIVRELGAICNDKKLSGLERLRKMFECSLSSSDRDIVYTVCPNMIEHPRLLAMQITEIFSDVAPHFILPVIEDGIKDGSIQTEFPKELSEVMMLLSNIWMNPLVLPCDLDSQMRKVNFFCNMLDNMGIHLLDETLMNDYIKYCQEMKEANEPLKDK